MTYLLRNIDPKLWQKVKARAATDGLPVRALILALLRSYAAGDITIGGQSSVTRRLA